MSPTLVQLARDRMPDDLGNGSVEFLAGDMLSKALGRFDHVVGMDSLIHYEKHDMVQVLTGLASRTGTSLLFIFAPNNLALAVMIRVGLLFPRGDRAPFIEPVSESNLRAAIGEATSLAQWQIGHTEKISSGFYTSQATELRLS